MLLLTEARHRRLTASYCGAGARWTSIPKVHLRAGFSYFHMEKKVIANLLVCERLPAGSSDTALCAVIVEHGHSGHAQSAAVVATTQLAVGLKTICRA